MDHRGAGRAGRDGHAVADPADRDVAGDVDDLEHPEDLDDPQGRPGVVTGAGPGSWPGSWPGRWPGAVPAWARGPAAVVVLVVVAALVATAVTTAHMRAQEEARRRAQAASLSLQVGTVTARTQDAAVPARPTPVDILVPLVNRGPDVLAVTVLGVTVAHQHTVRTPDAVLLHPGTMTRVPFSGAVDCALVFSPDSDRTSPAPPVVVTARVRTVGDASAGGAQVERTVQLPTFPDDSADLARQLFSLCHPVPEEYVSTSWAYPADGGVLVTVTNDNPPGTPPLVLGLSQSPGVRGTSRPALPMPLAGGRRVDLDLSADPDCAVVGDGSASTLHPVVLHPGGGVSRDLDRDYSDPATGQRSGTGAWLARLIALRCH